MSDSYPIISLMLKSLKDFQDKEFAADVLKLIDQYGKEFRPGVFGPINPLKLNYDSKSLDDAVNVWMNEEGNQVNAAENYAVGSLILKKKRGHEISYYIEWQKTNQAYFNSFAMDVDIDYLRDKDHQDQFINLCKELVVLIEPVQGSIVNASFPDWVAPMNLRVRHPELQWISFFGKPYIELVGRDKLLSAPCYKVHEIGDVIALQMTESVFESIPDDVRLAVKQHLGEEAFVAKGKHSHHYKTGLAPEFDFSNVLFDKTKPIVEPQIITRKR